MRPGTSNAERPYHPGGRTPVSRTPRRDVGGTPQTAVVAVSAGGHGHGHSRERALQDPGLKDYVGRPNLLPRVTGKIGHGPSLTLLLDDT